MLQPKGKNCLIEIITRADVMAKDVEARSGLLLSTARTPQGQPNTGVVHSIGPDVPIAAASEYKIGDTVVFHTDQIFQGFEWEGKKLVSIDYQGIIARIDS